MSGDAGTDTDVYWMRRAIDLSRLCRPSLRAYSVGAVLVGDDGEEMSFGYSRETEPHVHAEESALAKLQDDDSRLKRATMYSTLEPCSQRRSGGYTCAKLIIAAGIPRVVIAWREPALFVDECIGVEQLIASGVSVVELAPLAEAAKAVNSHLNTN